VGRAHGLHGEVAVTLTSDRHERVERGAVMHAGERELVVATSRPHRGRWLVRFEGIDNRTAAEGLRSAVLTATPLTTAGGDDELWVHELVGAEVRDRAGELLGRVTAVEPNPAHDLLVLDDGTLVPAVFVVEHRDGEVVVDVPPGLLDVNRRA
jgi:16S rRNA processing protein RimM